MHNMCLAVVHCNDILGGSLSVYICMNTSVFKHFMVWFNMTAQCDKDRKRDRTPFWPSTAHLVYMH